MTDAHDIPWLAAGALAVLGVGVQQGWWHWVVLAFGGPGFVFAAWVAINVINDTL